MRIRQAYRVNQVLFRKSLDKKRLSMAALARRLTTKKFPVTGSGVSRWATGHSCPASPAKMKAVATILGVPVWRLFPKLKKDEIGPGHMLRVAKKSRAAAPIDPVAPVLPLFGGTGVHNGGPAFALEGKSAATISDALQAANQELSLAIGASFIGADDNATGALHAIQVAKKCLAAIPRK